MGEHGRASDDQLDWLSWLLVGVLVLTIAENLVHGDLIWTGFLVVTGLILVFPAIAFRDPTVTLPPEVTALAVLPGVSRALGPAWVTEYATYVGVATVALAVVVELSLFTDVEMAPWLADTMVVLATMAAIGVWAVVQFYSDAFLGTEFVASTDAVMREFIRATIAGVVAAAVFELHFEYREPSDAAASDVAAGEDTDVPTGENADVSSGENADVPAGEN